MPSDWWAKKLGAQAPAPQNRSVPLYPGQGQPPPQQYAQQAYGAPVAMQPGTQMPAPAQAQQFYSYNEAGQMVPDDGHVAMLHNAAAMTGGSRAVKAATAQGRCPECGSADYFAVTTTENGMALRNPPAPRCWDCGFPIIQAGSSHGAANLAKRNGGPVGRTRQLPQNHEVRVITPEGQEMVFPAAGRRQ